MTSGFQLTSFSCKNTGEIVEVEPGEAEWLLDTLEGLLDFYFIQPALLKEKQEALNKKLAAAGKPPMKSAAEDEPATPK